MTSPILKRKLSSIDELFQELKDLKTENSYFSETLIDKEVLIEELSSSRGKELSGYLFTAKDLISRDDSNVTGGSRFLKDYRPPFNSSVYSALKKAGAINLVQSNLDEFGLGGSGLSSAYGKISNPIDNTRIIGGSSSGSVYLVYKRLVDFAITSDTGDSSRYPASLVGIIGFKPSYGLISRYGFFPFCSSFDTPSICACSMDVIARVMSVISFKDKHDLCTSQTEKKNYFEEMMNPLDKTVKIAVLEDTFWSKNPIDTDGNHQLKTSFYELMEALPKKMNVEVHFVKLKDNNIVRLCSLIYSIVAYSESVSNYANLTGLLFPFEEKKESVRPIKKYVADNYEDILFKNRAVLGNEFVFRQIMGKYFVTGENYESVYLQAKKFISYVNEEVSEIFSNYDVILSPTSFDIPESIEQHEGKYDPSNDLNLRLWANFCALPAISIPWKNICGMPVGLHLMSAYKTDGFLLNFSNKLLELFK